MIFCLMMISNMSVKKEVLNFNREIFKFIICLMSDMSNDKCSRKQCSSKKSSNTQVFCLVSDCQDSLLFKLEIFIVLFLFNFFFFSLAQ